VNSRIVEQQLSETATAQALKMYAGGVESLQVGGCAGKHPARPAGMQQYLADPYRLPLGKPQPCGLVGTRWLLLLTQHFHPKIIATCGLQPLGQRAGTPEPVEQGNVGNI